MAHNLPNTFFWKHASGIKKTYISDDHHGSRKVLRRLFIDFRAPWLATTCKTSGVLIRFLTSTFWLPQNYPSTFCTLK